MAHLRRPIRSGKTQDGVALLISIFVLLLICVVAIALIVSSGTESALSGNYRSATAVYYAALAGLEEARGRLLPKNPNYFLNTDANFLPPAGTPLAVGQVRYVIHQLSGETVAPWDTGNPATYPDTEYASEFDPATYPPIPTSPPGLDTIATVSTVAGIEGPLFKWVRINAVTEKSLHIDINNDGTKDSSTPIFYDPQHLDSSGNSQPSMIVSTNPPSSAVQVLELTSLAVLPNGTQKMLQYLVVASSQVALPPFPAAVTLVGNNVDYTGPLTSPSPSTAPPNWKVSGIDSYPVGGCNPGALPFVAVGYSNNTPGDPSRGNIDNGQVTGQSANYPGAGGTPSLGFIGNSIPSNFQTEAGLNAIAQNIIQNQLSDKHFTGNASGPELPSGMSPSNPMTIVVDGDLDLRNNFHSSGYGLLIVGGTFYYDPDSSWYGIVMVVGKGTIRAIGGRSSDTGQIVGALFVANTIGTPNPSGVHPMPNTSLPDSGDDGAEFPDGAGSAMGGNGIFYSSCWIKAATPTGSFHIISFHEITQ